MEIRYTPGANLLRATPRDSKTEVQPLGLGLTPLTCYLHVHISLSIDVGHHTKVIVDLLEL